MRTCGPQLVGFGPSAVDGWLRAMPQRSAKKKKAGVKPAFN